MEDVVKISVGDVYEFLIGGDLEEITVERIYCGSVLVSFVHVCEDELDGKILTKLELEQKGRLIKKDDEVFRQSD